MALTVDFPLSEWLLIMHLFQFVNTLHWQFFSFHLVTFSLSDSRRSWEESSRQSTKGAGALGKTQVSGSGLIKKLCRGIQQDWGRAALLALLFPTITLGKPFGWLVHCCTLSWQGWLLALWAGNTFQVNWIVFLWKPKSITLLPVCPQLEFTHRLVP